MRRPRAVTCATVLTRVLSCLSRSPLARVAGEDAVLGQLLRAQDGRTGTSEFSAFLTRCFVCRVRCLLDSTSGFLVSERPRPGSQRGWVWGSASECWARAGLQTPGRCSVCSGEGGPVDTGLSVAGPRRGLGRESCPCTRALGRRRRLVSSRFPLAFAGVGPTTQYRLQASERPYCPWRPPPARPLAFRKRTPAAPLQSCLRAWARPVQAGLSAERPVTPRVAQFLLTASCWPVVLFLQQRLLFS